MAWETRSALNPLLKDFILVARKLEKLGFIYHKGTAIAIKPCTLESG